MSSRQFASALRRALPMALLGLSLAAPGLAGERLQDPLRPPELGTHGTAAAQPASRAKAARPRWVLTSTLVSPERRLAVINGRSLSVGERLQGAELMQIYPDRVILRKGGKRFSVSLQPDAWKQPAGTQE